MENLKDRIIGIVLDACAYIDCKGSLRVFMEQNEYKEEEKDLASKQLEQCKHAYNKLMGYQFSDTSSIRMTEKKLEDLAFNLICS